MKRRAEPPQPRGAWSDDSRLKGEETWVVWSSKSAKVFLFLGCSQETWVFLENKPWTLLKFSCTARNQGPKARGGSSISIAEPQSLCLSTWRTRWLRPTADSGSRLCFCTAYYLLLAPFSDGRLESARGAGVAENSGREKTSSTPQSGAMHRDFSGVRDSPCETSRSESGTASLIK